MSGVRQRNITPTRSSRLGPEFTPPRPLLPGAVGHESEFLKEVRSLGPEVGELQNTIEETPESGLQKAIEESPKGGELQNTIEETAEVGLQKAIEENPSFCNLCLVMTLRASSLKQSPCTCFFKFAPCGIVVAQVTILSLLALQKPNHTIDWCPGGADTNAKIMMSAIACLYFVRVTSNLICASGYLNPLDRRESIKYVGETSWLREFMNIDESFSLIYGSMAYLINLWIVFDSTTLQDMVFNSLAAEFLTMVDKEFKEKCLKYLCPTKLARRIIADGWTEECASGRVVSRTYFRMQRLICPMRRLAWLISMISCLVALAMVFYGPACKP